MDTYCTVAFNDIKHLARSMPADGLKAQDVVPPRCGCWVAHKPSICRAFSHARARQPSQLSLISLAFLSRVEEIWAARGSIISGPVRRSATAFNFCIQGQIWFTRHLVIGSQGPRFRAAARLARRCARRTRGRKWGSLRLPSRLKFVEQAEVLLALLAQHVGWPKLAVVAGAHQAVGDEQSFFDHTLPTQREAWGRGCSCWPPVLVRF